MTGPATSRPLASGSWVAPVAAILLLAAGIVAAFYEEQLYQTQRLAALRQQAEILAASVTAAVSFGDQAAADEYVRPMQVNPAIEAAGVYLRDGHLLAGFAREGRLPAALDRAAESEKDPNAIVVPIAQRNIPLGLAYLRASPEPARGRIGRNIVLALLAGMTALVVAGLGSAQSALRRQALRLEEANDLLTEEMAERAKAEEALRQSQKMEAIGQLSGGIAHDFNNHLMIVKGNLHLLARRLGLAAEDKYLSNAMEGIDRAAALTQRILSFSRRQTLSPAPTDLDELIRGMHELLHSSLRENIRFEHRSIGRWQVVVDRNQMENVILNLVINARDAMPNGGTVDIEVEDVALSQETARGLGVKDGDYVQLTVRDTGSGMTEAVRAKALDPFFTTKPVGQGTGLGLSTTFGFVTQSGGQMQIESAPGRGTAVVIFLPRLSADQSSARSSE